MLTVTLYPVHFGMAGGIATQLLREVRMLWWTQSGLQADATSESQVMAGGASTKVVFTLPLPSYLPLPYQFYRTLSLSPTPPLLYLLVREGRAQTPFITSEHFSSLSLSPCLVYPIKSFINFGTLFLRLSILFVEKWRAVCLICFIRIYSPV